MAAVIQSRDVPVTQRVGALNYRFQWFGKAEAAMAKNRKKAETYRLNGYPHLDAGSIHSVKIPDLELRIKGFEAKLADPLDPDDKRWTAWWLGRFRRELDKKRAGLTLKRRERGDRRRTRRSADPGAG
jgi:hypothetical protein